MRTSLTFSVLFWIYAKRARNNQTNIYVRITLNGKKVNISLKQKVDVDVWDAKGQKERKPKQGKGTSKIQGIFVRTKNWVLLARI